MAERAAIVPYGEINIFCINSQKAREKRPKNLIYRNINKKKEQNGNLEI